MGQEQVRRCITCNDLYLGEDLDVYVLRLDYWSDAEGEVNEESSQALDSQLLLYLETVLDVSNIYLTMQWAARRIIGNV